jgi:hypothetical protein
LAAVRIYADYPALDRSGDHRPEEVLRNLTAGLSDRHGVLLADLNWQLHNGLTYFVRHEQPEIVSARMSDVLLYAPALIRDNLVAGRDVVLTDRARRSLAAAYGPLFTVEADADSGRPSLAELVGNLPPGTAYVLTLLRPSREFELDRQDLARAVDVLTGRRARLPADREYAVLAGVVGRAPALLASSDRPFRTRSRLNDLDVVVRIDSWLAFDTIRRMGFGHVIADRRHAQILERGLNFVAIDRTGRTVASTYRAGVFAPQPRFIVREVRLGARAIVDP